MSSNVRTRPMPGPSRRSVTRAAAWSVPVVATVVSAPAFAASPCDARPGAVDWSLGPRYSRASASTATYTVPDPDGTGPGQPLVLTVTNTFLGTNTRLGDQWINYGWQGGVNDNLRTATGVGGSSSSTTSLVLHQSPWRDADKVGTWSTTSNRSITTFSFSREVTDLSFIIRDIDSSSGDFWDGIALSGTTFTSTKSNSGYVSGTGAVSDPFRSGGVNYPVGDNATDGNVTISMASVTSFEFHYWNLSDTGSSADGDQKVFLSGMSFAYRPC